MNTALTFVFIVLFLQNVCFKLCRFGSKFVRILLQATKSANPCKPHIYPILLAMVTFLPDFATTLYSLWVFQKATFDYPGVCTGEEFGPSLHPGLPRLLGNQWQPGIG